LHHISLLLLVSDVYWPETVVYLPKTKYLFYDCDHKSQEIFNCFVIQPTVNGDKSKKEGKKRRKKEKKEKKRKKEKEKKKRRKKKKKEKEKKKKGEKNGEKSHCGLPVLQVFHNCTCIGEIMTPAMTNTSAELGQCQRNSNCDNKFKIYMALSVIGSFISACGGTPGYIVLLR